MNDITWFEHIWNKIINFFNPLGFPVDERAGGYRLWEERKAPPKYSWFWIIAGFSFCGLGSCAISVSSAYAYGNYQYQQSVMTTLTALAPESTAEVQPEITAEVTAESTAEVQPSATPSPTSTTALQIEALPTRILPSATSSATPTDVPPTQHPGTLTAEAFRLLPTFTLTPSLIPMSTRPINRSEVQPGQAPIQQPVQGASGANVRVLSTNVVIAPLADNWQATATANPFWLIASSTPAAESTEELAPSATPTASSTPTDAPLPVLMPRDSIPTLAPTATVGNS